MKKIMAGLIAALVLAGCGGASSKAAPRTAPSTVSAPATATATPTDVLDADAKLACSRTDDALNQYNANPDSLTADEPFIEGVTKALGSKSPGLSTLALSISDAKIAGAPSDPIGPLIAGFPANAGQVRDWCIAHSWTSTSSAPTP